MIPGRWCRTCAMIKKEFLQVLRDPSSMMIAFILPLILLFLYGFGLSLDAEKVKIGIVNEDESPDSKRFLLSLQNSSYFIITYFPNRVAASEAIVAGNQKGLVIIPSYFSQHLQDRNQVAPIQVIADGSEPNTAAFAQNYIQGAWESWKQQEKISTGKDSPPALSVQTRVWYNEELNSHYFLFPGSIAIIMTLIGTLLTAVVIAREWERGTMEALMATPVTIGEIILSKLIPYYCLGMGSMILCTVIAQTVFQIPLRGSFLVLAGVSSAFLLTALGGGLWISTIARNQFIAIQMSLVIGFLPAFMLSGFLFEISSMPEPIQLLTRAIPARYFVTSLLTIFLVGNIWQVLIPATLYMLFIAVFVFTLVGKRTVKRLD